MYSNESNEIPFEITTSFHMYCLPEFVFIRFQYLLQTNNFWNIPLFQRISIKCMLQTCKRKWNGMFYSMPCVINDLIQISFMKGSVWTCHCILLNYFFTNCNFRVSVLWVLCHDSLRYRCVFQISSAQNRAIGSRGSHD